MVEQKNLNAAIEVIAGAFKKLSESSLDSIIDSQEGELSLSDAEIEEASVKVHEGAHSHYTRVKNALNLVALALSADKVAPEFERAAQKCQQEIKSPQEFAKRISENETPGHILGFSDRFVESLVDVAKKFSDKKDFRAASDILWFVCSLDPMEGDYWMALGQAEQQAERYSEAIQAYSMNVLLDEDNPKAYFYAAQCSKASGDLTEAALAVDYALTIAREDPANASLIPELEKFQKTLR